MLNPIQSDPFFFFLGFFWDIYIFFFLEFFWDFFMWPKPGTDVDCSAIKRTNPGGLKSAQRRQLVDGRCAARRRSHRPILPLDNRSLALELLGKKFHPPPCLPASPPLPFQPGLHADVAAVDLWKIGNVIAVETRPFPRQFQRFNGQFPSEIERHSSHSTIESFRKNIIQLEESNSSSNAADIDSIQQMK